MTLATPGLMLNKIKNKQPKVENLTDPRKTIAAAILFLASTGIADAATCIVNAHSTSNIGAATKGIIANILVERADRVRQGDVLAELEASAEDAAIAAARLEAENDLPIRLAQARYETARLGVARQRQLDDRQLTSKADLEQALLEEATARLEEEEARLRKKQAVLELEAAIQARERKRLRAPFDGIVTSRLMSKGELYTEQNPILVMARIDPLHVETYLPFADYDKIAIGDVLKVALESGEVLDATVQVIDPVLDAATGTFGVRLELPNPNADIIAGQSCTVQLVGN